MAGIVVVLTPVRGANSISIDAFKIITSYEERDKLIDQAPPERQNELIKIDHHLRLLSHFGGEAKLKYEKERQVSLARGFEFMEELFSSYAHIWDGYIAATMEKSKKEGNTHDQLVRKEKELDKEQRNIYNRVSIAHSIIFNMAASPQALELEKKAEVLLQDWQARLINNRITMDGPGPHPHRPITKEERIEVDKQIDKVFEEMKKLPALTPEQAQKEYNDFPEERIRASFL